MLLETIACNQCGAPLSIPDAAQFVTCNHCGANLRVRREASISYTEVLSELTEQTANLSEQVAKLRYQNAVAEVDRKWERERELLLGHNEHNRVEPSSIAAILVGSAIVIGGLVSAAAMRSLEFAIWPIGVGLLIAVGGGYKNRKFENARAAYRRRRAAISIARFRKPDDEQVTADDIPELK